MPDHGVGVHIDEHPSGVGQCLIFQYAPDSQLELVQTLEMAIEAIKRGPLENRSNF